MAGNKLNILPPSFLPLKKGEVSTKETEGVEFDNFKR